jgi:serine/threonine protein kinase/thioredoxin-like negative regulator of GroEL
MQGTVIGNWTIGRMIGEGGMGQVYLASHNRFGTQAAVKVLYHALANDPKFRERFYHEAQSQSSLSHSNIAKVLDYVEQNGQYFLVVEYLEGGTISEAIARAGGPIDIHQALQWTKQALLALDYAHQRRIIHRDLKPSNIMLDRDSHAHVMDFGIALVMGGRRMTSTGVAIGTAEYMSPEQISRPKDLDHRTDVYSMGIVLYEMLTGRVPFERDTEFAVKSAQVSDPPPPPRTVNPQIPEPLERIVMRALAKDPNYRYSGCGEFARTIETFERTGQAIFEGPAATPVVQSSPPSQPHPVHPQPTPPAPSPKNKKAIPILIAASALALAAIAGFYWRMTSTSKLDRYYKMRDALETNRKWSDIEREYRDRIRKEPDDPLLYGMLIESLMRQSKYDQAAQAARDAQKVDAQEALWPDLLGDALSQEGKTEEARAAYWEAVRLEHNDKGERYAYQGDLSSLDQKWPDAESNYREAVKLKPDRPLWKVILSGYLQRQEKWSEAETLIQDALKQSPDHAGYHFSLGQCYLSQKKFPEAEKSFREAVRLNQYFGIYRLNLGFALEGQEKKAEAEEQYRAARELDPDNAPMRNAIGDAFARQNRWAEAEVEYQKAASLDGKSSDYFYNLGLAQSEQQKWGPASKSLHRAVELDPEHEASQWQLCLALIKQKDWIEAEKHCRKAKEIAPDNGDYHAVYGLTLMAQNRMPEAESALKYALLKRPDNALYHNALGDLLFRQSRYEEAEEYYARAAQIEPDNKEYQDDLQSVRRIRSGQ